ncbi:hypothetical protein [Martelella alba]|uniref:hypothetical protein n=1 Tax=Martelella alba TaxID=2590451 RepID=UPI00113224FF|nr:hypothetical protein [Martelella alba]
MLILVLISSGCTLSQVGGFEDAAAYDAACFREKLYEAVNFSEGCPRRTNEAPSIRAGYYNERFEYLARAEYANQLSYQYRRAARRASQGQDFGAVSIIASAGTAAGGLLFGSSLNLVKGAGLAAGLADANLGYFQPKQAQLSLLLAASKANCIATAAQPEPLDMVAGRQVLNDAISAVEISLAEALVRDTPSFETLVAALRAAGTSVTKEMNEGGIGGRTVENLKHDVDLCLGRSS